MKTIILSLAILATTPVMAFVDVPTFPTESDWAKAMTQQACHVKFSKSAVGEIYRVGDGHANYTVYNKHGEVIAMAAASSEFIGAEKLCVWVKN